MKKYEEPEYDGQFKLKGKIYYYRGKDDTGSSYITHSHNEEKCYRSVMIYDSETGLGEVMSMYCGDTFTLYPEDVKQEYEKILKNRDNA